MKKALLFITSVVFILAGCQDEQTPSANQTQQAAAVASAVEVVSNDGHSANTALDWNGTYIGTLPCADCQGIETKITLNHDGSYSIQQAYLGKENGTFESQGQLSWNEQGNTITLENESGANHYFVGENILFMLDMNGERIQGDLAQHYQLRKQ